MPRVCRSRWNLMTWADPEIIYTTKATFGFKRNICCVALFLCFFEILILITNKSHLRRWTLKWSSQVWKAERIVKALDLETIFSSLKGGENRLRHWTLKRSLDFWWNEEVYELVLFWLFLLFINLQSLKEKLRH